MSIRIYYDPLKSACKNISGAIRKGDTLQLNVFVLKEDAQFEEKQPFILPREDQCKTPEDNAFLQINKDGEQPSFFSMRKTGFGWQISLRVDEIGLYYYHFIVENRGNISCGALEIGYLSQHVQSFLLTVHSEDYQTPDWFKGGVMYQIFPDRFCKKGTMPDITGRIARTNWGELPFYKPNENGKVLNNDFFGGNFQGIQSKLDYLNRLRITTIYLNPIFEAASNHRYDTSNYMKIDPFLGSDDDFLSLIKDAKTYDMRIILDGVFNHTGDDSVYFNKYGKYDSLGAYQSKDSPYYTWYSFQEFPDKYSSWWGIDILPEVNENSEDYQNFIFEKGGVLKHWLQYGIGGYRLDVADELPDFFLKKLRKSVKEEDPDAIIIGEVWEDASNKIAYSQRREYLQGYELDSVMNYPLKDGIIQYIQSGDAFGLLHTVRVLINHYPKQTLDCLMNILGTHDTSRILTVLGGIYCSNKDEMASSNAYLTPENKEKSIEKLKMAAVLQYTLPGVPCLYYGDENGMEGHIDPFCRQCFNWNDLNEKLINFYCSLGKIRAKYRAVFKDGEWKELITEDGFLLFKRRKENQAVYVYTNNSSKCYQLKLPKNYTDCFTDQIIREKDLFIQPYSYGIFFTNEAETTTI